MGGGTKQLLSSGSGVHSTKHPVVIRTSHPSGARARRVSGGVEAEGERDSLRFAFPAMMGEYMRTQVGMTDELHGGGGSLDAEGG